MKMLNASENFGAYDIMFYQFSQTNPAKTNPSFTKFVLSLWRWLIIQQGHDMRWMCCITVFAESTSFDSFVSGKY